MKFPSLRLLVDSTALTIQRFPFALLAAVVGSILSMLLIEVDFDKDVNQHLVRGLLTCTLALPLLFAIHVFIESHELKPIVRLAIFVMAFGVLFDFYFSAPFTKYGSTDFFYKYFFWNAAFHLLASFSVFFTTDRLQGFWQFNKTLFLRFLIAALYSSVLFIGLAGAILASDNLFNLNIRGEVYGHLWVLIAGVFNTTFFLAGLPYPIHQLQDETDYPKGLKVFTQFILLPIVTIYLAILYLYVLKITFTWSLPKGWVANLILGFSVTGMLSLLLVYPVRNMPGNKWIKTFSSLYYYSSIPLVVLLFIAIGKRIGDYGVTIERYMVAMLGVWLAGIVIYFIINKGRNIIIIPISLFLIVLGSSFGPWGMFKVSEQNQLKHLKVLLEKHKALNEGKIVQLSKTESAKIPPDDANRIASIVKYLVENHGSSCMYPILNKDCVKDLQNMTDMNNYDAESIIADCMGIHGNAYSYRSENSPNVQVYRFSNDSLVLSSGIPVKGYETIYSFYGYVQYATNDNYDNGLRCRIEKNTVTYKLNNEILFKWDANNFLNRINWGSTKSTGSNELPMEQMTFAVEDRNGTSYTLLLSDANVEVKDTVRTLTNVNGYLLRK